MMTLNAETIATRNVSGGFFVSFCSLWTGNTVSNRAKVGGFNTRYYRIIQTLAYIVAVLVLYFLVQHYHQQIYNLEEYPLSYQ